MQIEERDEKDGTTSSKTKDSPTRRAILRPYQERLVGQLCRYLTTSKPNDRGRVEAVLALSPGGGKTLTSIEVVGSLLASGAVKRVLVLAHATRLLRNQYASTLAREKRPFTHTEYVAKVLRPGGGETSVSLRSVKARVVVCIPQSVIHRRKALRKGGFDLIVVDEAHQYYAAPGGMVDSIINKTGAQKVLLLTGTPSIFVAQGYRLFTESYFDLLAANYAGNVRVELATESQYDISNDDYTPSGEVRADYRYRAEDTAATLDKLFHGMSIKRRLRKWRKTMIACATIAMAKQVVRYFSAKDIDADLCTHEDKCNESIDRFRKDDGPPLLVVVNKGVLGFDMLELCTVVDLRGSRNIDVCSQLLHRVTRKHPKKYKKRFIKVMPKSMAPYGRALMEATVLLGDENILRTWNGSKRALKRMAIPNPSPSAQA